ncbi:hypothetical protein [Capnocytophaga catalasegens]|uniref:Uncharacterized protein n=1 Tax=Capnocytophaga catalasegens TaxID=1004260 RepID=A0AAV5AXW7_9FLAO|nr:hypothetical protein [Capnocytophaga catalasegens]GIZ16584.1 hypothetical protein RCZ03_25840 [Capnocytophaga catalasegens]GJM51589.1 hypothetical protein RCZ15_25620 [Capnocytophaga catalasegens]GJM53699.1 hypothetical protein RCZ16_20150 [Capnocytophaga catalasegens]
MIGKIKTQMSSNNSQDNNHETEATVSLINHYEIFNLDHRNTQKDFNVKVLEKIGEIELENSSRVLQDFSIQPVDSGNVHRYYFYKTFSDKTTDNSGYIEVPKNTGGGSGNIYIPTYLNFMVNEDASTSTYVEGKANEKDGFSSADGLILDTSNNENLQLRVERLTGKEKVVINVNPDLVLKKLSIANQAQRGQEIIRIDQTGIDAGNKPIQNVAKATEDTQVITLGQLKEILKTLGFNI